MGRKARTGGRKVRNPVEIAIPAWLETGMARR
jgi:hypothetical protein